MQEKLSLLSELIHLAKTDHQLDENEIGFIQAIAKSLKVPDADLANLFDNPVRFDPPASDGDRIIQFHRLVLLMNVDHVATSAEMSAIRTAGIRLGLNPMATNEVLKRMHDYPNKVIPPDELIRIFMKHQN